MGLEQSSARKILVYYNYCILLQEYYLLFTLIHLHECIHLVSKHEKNVLMEALFKSVSVFQVLALVFVRKLLDFCFTKRELSWLDDLMPESKKKTEDDKKNKKAKQVQRSIYLINK